MLRGRRVVTAAQLSAELGISLRTLYRDISDLSLSGVPILGEAGVGYRMGAGFEVPPIMFTIEEVEVLVAGIRMMASWGGPALAPAGRSALEKITHALPESRRKEITTAHIYAPGFHVPAATYAHLAPARRAIGNCEKIHIGYRDQHGKTSQRTVRPLALFFWGAQWTLLAWCDSRDDFRTFRLDRIATLEFTGDHFPEDALKSLPEFLRKVRQVEL
jgi:predicted DNA-binding transcriptional regulator YafY